MCIVEIVSICRQLVNVTVPSVTKDSETLSIEKQVVELQMQMDVVNSDVIKETAVENDFLNVIIYLFSLKHRFSLLG